MLYVIIELQIFYNMLKIGIPHSYWLRPGLSYLNRSEGVAERDIGSLRMMGWGLMLAENSSAVAAVTGPPGGVL